MKTFNTAMISSTALDLPEHRKQAIEACRLADIVPIAMEYLAAQDALPVDVCMEMVDRADIYIGIYAWRYGWVPSGSEVSITEMEFNRAVERGIPILVFLIHKDHSLTIEKVETDKDAQEKLKEFKKRASMDRIRADFKSPDDLRGAIIHALGKLKERELASPDPLPSILLSGTATRPKQVGPAGLLNARYEVVPFMDAVRQKELDILSAWRDDLAATSVRLFTGPGGTGKTRLFIEWTERLRGQGWHAGFLPEDAGDDKITALLDWRQPTLVVLDYAETRSNLRELLKKIAGRAKDGVKPLRVVLLAREMGDWWKSLLERDPEIHDLLCEYEPWRVEPVLKAGDWRRQVFVAARDQFAKELGKEAASQVIPPLDDYRFERVLYLHMAGLAVVEGLSPDPGKLLDEVVAHEKRFWGKVFVKEIGSDDLAADMFREKASRLVAAVTLCGGLPSVDEAKALNGRVGGPADVRFLQVLRRIYPGRDGQVQRRFLSPLEPDLLGESLVTDVLSDANTSDRYLDRVFENASADALQNGFVVLGRISARRSDKEESWLRRVLGVDVLGRAMPAFEAAKSLGAETAFSPLACILAEMLTNYKGTVPVELAWQIVDEIPVQTVSLCELGVWAAQRLLADLPDSAKDETTLAERAGLLNNLSVYLSGLGRREEALAATGEAVDHYRRLAEARPDAFLPYLAMSLNNLGNRLSELGRREDALASTGEAVEHYRRLAESRPDAFLPDLAGSLNNLGMMLSGLGRREDALAATGEAVEHYRRLAEARPDAFLPDLAASLNNLGNMLSELGRREDALASTGEAVEHYRRLAEARPDAFLPDLAMSLNNLGNRLSELGRREDALAATVEAVEIRRRLAEARPDAFLPDLAMSLNNLGIRLSELGRREDALAATVEAVEIRRRLAEARPDAFLPDLAMSLNNLGMMLSALGRREDALAATGEALEHYRRLAAARPDAFLPDLAMSLNNLGNDLSELGRREDALAATREAVEHYRGLAEARPDAFLPYLAMSLNNLGMTLSELGRREEALAATGEAGEIYRRLAEARPDAFLPYLAMSLNNLGNRLSELGRREDALAAAREAVEINSRLVQAIPAAFGEEFMKSLGNLFKRFEEAGKPDAVLPAIVTAVEIAEKLGLGDEKKPD